jgi:hypothetical protein
VSNRTLSSTGNTATLFFSTIGTQPRHWILLAAKTTVRKTAVARALEGGGGKYCESIAGGWEHGHEGGRRLAGLLQVQTFQQEAGGHNMGQHWNQIGPRRICFGRGGLIRTSSRLAAGTSVAGPAHRGRHTTNQPPTHSNESTVRVKSSHSSVDGYRPGVYFESKSKDMNEGQPQLTTQATNNNKQLGVHYTHAYSCKPPDPGRRKKCTLFKNKYTTGL